MPVPECATSRPSEKDAATPWNTRVDNIFRVYSVGRGRGRGAIFAGRCCVDCGRSSRVRLRTIFFTHSRPHRHFFHPPAILPFPSGLLSPVLVSVRNHSPPESLRSAPREARGSTRCYTLGSNLRTAGATQTNARCARREGVRRIFVFAHSRANAHPSSCGGIFRREEDCPPSCSIGTRGPSSSCKRLSR